MTIEELGRLVPQEGSILDLVRVTKVEHGGRIKVADRINKESSLVRCYCSHTRDFEWIPLVELEIAE